MENALSTTNSIPEAKLLQAFADSSEAAFYIKDKKGQFIYINRQGAKMLGLTFGDVIGKTAFDFLP